MIEKLKSWIDALLVAVAIGLFSRWVLFPILVAIGFLPT